VLKGFEGSPGRVEKSASYDLMMVIPAVGVRVLLDCRWRFQGLETDSIGLGWGVSSDV